MISPDGKGWVKAPSKKRTVPVSRADQAAVLKSPLAYFACAPSAPSKPKIPDCPVYTLDPNQHTPPTSEQGRPKKGKRAHNQGRSASSPSHRHRHPYDDEYDQDFEEEDGPYHTTAHHGGAVRPSTASRSTISYDRVRPRGGRPAAGTSLAPRPSPAPKPRAVTSAPAPASASAGGYSYWTGPSNRPRVPPRSAAWSGGSGGSVSSGASARWANATAPLAL